MHAGGEPGNEGSGNLRNYLDVVTKCRYSEKHIESACITHSQLVCYNGIYCCEMCSDYKRTQKIMLACSFFYVRACLVIHVAR